MGPMKRSGLINESIYTKLKRYFTKMLLCEPVIG